MSKFPFTHGGYIVDTVAQWVKSENKTCEFCHRPATHCLKRERQFEWENGDDQVWWTLVCQQCAILTLTVKRETYNPNEFCTFGNN